VLLVDAYGPANIRASSGAESRIIRAAHGGREIYARWALESRFEWLALAARSGLLLFQPAGVLTIVPDGDRFVTDTMACLTRLGSRVECLSGVDVERRFPQFRLAPHESAILEPDGGALMARHAIAALVSELLANGAEYRQAKVRAPTGMGTLDSVATWDGELLKAGGFVFACGPWLPKLFPALLHDKLRIERAEAFFLGLPSDDATHRIPAMPAWIDAGVPGGAYGLPGFKQFGCKVAVDSIDRPADPDIADRCFTAQYVAQMHNYVRRRIPGLGAAPLVHAEVCQYEMTLGEDYILDRHPGFENVWIVGGGSGHGFKNGPAVGRYVAAIVAGQSAADSRFSISA
jgi:glycine/D-amino acid oxidase-like deaminating enzyme